MRAFLGTVVVVVGVVSGCGNPTAPDPVLTTLPETLFMSGEASATDPGGLAATCTFALRIDLLRETSRTRNLVTYTGTKGGEVRRQVWDATGAGFEFVAHTFADIEVQLMPSGRLDLRVPVNETTDSRFYQALAHFEGPITKDGVATGSWTCAPLDLEQGGYKDTSVTATGTWTIEPLT
jgi:hypothetical protein